MKADYHLLPWGGVESVAFLMTLMGQWKYKEPKWKTIGTTEHVNAAIRHIRGWLAEEEDEESGMSHLVHAATRLLMAVEREMGEWETDEGNNREDGDGGDGTPPLMAGGFMTEGDPLLHPSEVSRLLGTHYQLGKRYICKEDIDWNNPASTRTIKGDEWKKYRGYYGGEED